MLVRYACLKCPPGKWALPKTGVTEIHSKRCSTTTGHKAFGWIDCDRELSEEEIQEYGLELILKQSIDDTYIGE